MSEERRWLTSWLAGSLRYIRSGLVQLLSIHVEKRIRSQGIVIVSTFKTGHVKVHETNPLPRPESITTHVQSQDVNEKGF